MFLNFGAGEDSWETLGQQGDQASQLLRKSILNIGRTDAEAVAPILQPSDVKSWLIGKDPDAGKDWRQEEKGATEDEMVGYCPLLNGHEFEQTPGDSEGQGCLACCSPWGCRVGHNLAIQQQQQQKYSAIYYCVSDYSPPSCIFLCKARKGLL